MHQSEKTNVVSEDTVDENRPEQRVWVEGMYHLCAGKKKGKGEGDHFCVEGGGCDANDGEGNGGMLDGEGRGGTVCWGPRGKSPERRWELFFRRTLALYAARTLVAGGLFGGCCAEAGYIASIDREWLAGELAAVEVSPAAKGDTTIEDALVLDTEE